MQARRIINPPARIGIIGGGQLGRMITQEAKRMGYYVVVLDPTENSPAAQIADQQIVAGYTDHKEMTRLAKDAQVITYEFEHIDAKVLRSLEEAGTLIIPSGAVLEKIQNKYLQKTILKAADIPVPQFWKVQDRAELDRIIEQKGLPLVLKTCCGGYDGKGNFVLRQPSDADAVMNDFGGGHFFIEEYVDFIKELSVMIAVDNDGDMVRYPVAENIHVDSILRMTRVPADIGNDIESQIADIAQKVVKVFGSAGVFCIEMFLDAANRLYINEIAPRPHNSGHYTIEACATSQYEQLLRILTGMPLGSAELLSPCVMVNILGESDLLESDYSVEGLHKMLALEKVYFHWYGKSKATRLRKLGHVTVLSDTVDHAAKTAQEALAHIRIKNKGG